MDTIAYRADKAFIADGTILAGNNLPAAVSITGVSEINYRTMLPAASHEANGPEGINRRGFLVKEGLTGTPGLDDLVFAEEGLFTDDDYTLQLTGLLADHPYRLGAFVEKYGNYFFSDTITPSPVTKQLAADTLHHCRACNNIFLEDRQRYLDTSICPNCGEAIVKKSPGFPAQGGE